MKRTTVAELEILIKGIENRVSKLEKKPQHEKDDQPSRFAKLMSKLPTIKLVDGGLLILLSRRAHPEV
jgi:hypothetical protein